MSEMRERWEGRTVDGRFPLESYLGGSEHSAVFLTRWQKDDEGDFKAAAIKLIPCDGARAEKQLARWRLAREFNHPNLIRIFETGRVELDGGTFVYVVEEYAEENLAQILPERALTVEETRGLLPAVLGALQYVHDKGFVHGHIQPSNILAQAYQVKLSTDALSAPGEPAKTASVYDPPEAAVGVGSAADTWQLGMTLIEVLMQRLPAWDRTGANAPEIPAAVPEPFREIARHCLEPEAGKRWTIADIRDRLEGKTQVSAERPAERQSSASAGVSDEHKASAKWPYGLGLIAAAAIAFFLITYTKSSRVPPEAQSTAAQSGQSGQPTTSASTPQPGQEETKPSAGENVVVRRVMPQVLPSARRTIHGTIIVKVKVRVDGAGNVVKATLESGRTSKYFSRVAMEAARDWKFSPAPANEPGDREWKLQFGFSRAKTEASAVAIKR